MSTTRVNQLDAELLDQELEQILIQPFIKTISTTFQLQSDNEPLTLIIQLLISAYSILQQQQQQQPSISYGAQLSNLQWVNRSTHRPLSRPRLASYLLLSLLPPYIYRRLRDRIISRGWPDQPRATSWRACLHPVHRYRTLAELINRLETLLGLLQLLNFLRFLHTPTHRSLLQRLLNISLRPLQPRLSSAVSFEFLNRQIVWQALTDFILFMLPLVDLRRLKLRLRAIATRIRATLSGPPTSSQLEGASPEGRPAQRTAGGRPGVGELPADQCPICASRRLAPRGEPLVSDPSHPRPAFPPALLPADLHLKIPYQLDCCNGLYCYACLLPDIIRWRDAHLDHQPWICWRCQRSPLKIHRWNGSSNQP